MVKPDQTSLIVKKTLRRRLKEVAAKLDLPMEVITEQALENYLFGLEKSEVANNGR